ncbi:hypothetical protein [Escherichia coli]|uniref:hypothetical protein n=1 Tax=Escherichia coli TaxID=562 RepID=UPI000BDE6035|nr:hypothetical protein [Escherichia coli]EFB1291005.1 hypothetical protein [Escherichia coli]EFB1300645.1 hypothetical protein [Escherichia coli]EFB9456148.1 hypothetical protein [Escherichia coli]EFH4247802.1 hypothetical protein [Escherichia coli]EFN0005301.1 hypothetical protein [Escherichia coli]
MAYGNKPYPKSPLPTGDFKSSEKRLVAREKDNIITIYYEGTDDVYCSGEDFPNLEAAQNFCEKYNNQLNIS